MSLGFVVLCACQPSGDAPQSGRVPGDHDVLALSANRDIDATHEAEAHIRNWSRAYHSHPEGGVWVQSDYGRPGPYGGSLSSVTKACQQYLRRHDPGCKYNRVAYAHHARLWALNFEAVARAGEVAIGGARTLWYDTKQGRVIAETRQP